MILHGSFNIGEYSVINFVDLSDDEKRMVLTWRNHNNVRKWMYSDDFISEEEHFNFIDKLVADNSRFYWVVKKKDEYFGTISLNKIDFNNKHTYLGIYSNPYNPIKNKGFSLIQCIKKLAFEIAEMHTLKLEVIEHNHKAIKFYKKSGFNEEGILKEFVFKDEKWHDVIVMGLINSS
jgi:UDP-4-amino-4,6-dideoxy-N-acetyl-beta-L-altrosamine N-acetyltransferase